MAQRRAKIWEIREDYRPLLIKTKKLFPTLLAHVKTKRVALVGLQARNSPFMAKIHCNRRPWSLFLKQYDYLIMFWSTRFDDKKRSYKTYVMLHELWHIAEDGFDRHGPGYRKLRRHDVEDYKLLRGKYGMHLENVKEVLEGEVKLLEYSKKFKSESGARIG